MGTKDSDLSINLISAYNPDFVIHNGDFAYDMHDNEGKVGDEFLGQIQKVASKIPYVVNIGNHDVIYSSHYRTKFATPSGVWPTPKKSMWYSFDVGQIHFIAYSSETFYTGSQTGHCSQYDWLKKDLEKANRNRKLRPWIIAFAHRPMYCSAFDFDDCTTGNSLVKQAFEKLFYAYGVDIIVESHEHMYERTYPVFDGIMVQNNYIDPKAPIHFITGAGGSREGRQLAIDLFRREWSAFIYRSHFTVSHFQAVNSSHIYWKQIRSTDNKTIDKITIVQNYHGPFNESMHSALFCTRIVLYIPPLTVFILCFAVTFLLCLSAIVFYCPKRDKSKRLTNYFGYDNRFYLRDDYE
ncbi:unnamed protein product [Dimorphilus gyrociliatus]|uniref:Uncharacterized protein n=1 Tax=Dimorphilus gyrociliatus TaxID=2664684 RepID=A0A7I8VMG8_9ANNE|nr:unnamed protein product [Dimorphilus gyrociliatus]